MSDQDNVVVEGPAVVKSRRGRRALGFVLAMLVVLLGLSAFLLVRLISPPKGPMTNQIGEPDPNGGVTWVSSVYGMSNSPADQLSRVQSVVPAADGSLWVTDSIHRSLMHFATDGRFIAQITGPADSQLEAPSRMAIGPDGLLYVCETRAGAIRVLRSDNTDAGSFGVPQPVSVAVSADRIVVGSVAGFAIIDKSNPEKPLHVIGTRGKGDNQFDYVHGVAIGANGTIYVVDSYNNRLSAYTPEGKRLWIVRTGNPSNSAKLVGDSLSTTRTADLKVSGDKTLQLPLGLTIDGAGRLVVTDMFDCSLGVFDAKNGAFIGKYGSAGAEDGQFFYPVSVGYDPGRDWFTVADSLSDRVQVVRIAGSASGSGAPSALNRALAGPMRALLLPAALLLVAGIAALVVALVRRRRAKKARLVQAAGTSGA